jgi:hypothetical protein
VRFEGDGLQVIRSRPGNSRFHSLLKDFRDSRVLKGRGFSRAARDAKISRALAAEVVGVIEQLAFQRLQRPR